MDLSRKPARLSLIIIVLSCIPILSLGTVPINNNQEQQLISLPCPMYPKQGDVIVYSNNFFPPVVMATGSITLTPPAMQPAKNISMTPATGNITTTLPTSITTQSNATQSITPTATVNPIVPPGYEDYARYFDTLWRKYGWISLPLLAIIIVLFFAIKIFAQEFAKTTSNSVGPKLSNWIATRIAAPKRSQYLAFLRHRYGEIDLGRVRTISGQPLRPKVEDIFVPLHIIPGLPSHDIWSDQRLEVKYPDKDGLPDHAVSMDGTNRLLALDAILSHRFTVVLGEPGSGKTTLLTLLTSMLSSESAIPPPPICRKLPVPISIQSFSSEVSQNHSLGLKDFIIQNYKSVSSIEIEPVIDHALSSSGVILLVDGLNEVRSIDLRRLVVEKILDFYVQHKDHDVRIVITSRVAGYHDAPILHGDAWTGTLAPLSIIDMQTLITRFYGLYLGISANNKMLDAQVRKQVEGLVRKIIGNKILLTLAGRPSCICVLAYSEIQSSLTAPETKAEVYEQDLQTYVQAWRSSPSHDADPELNLDVVNILGGLALKMSLQTNGDSGVINATSLAKWIEEILISYYRIESSRSILVANKLIQEIRQRTGLLIEIKNNIFAFHHQAIQEYLAAKGIASLIDRDLDSVYKVFSDHLSQPHWVEILRLSIGCMSAIEMRTEFINLLFKYLLEYQFPDSEKTTSIIAIADLALEVRMPLDTKVLSRILDMLLIISTSDNYPLSQRIRAGIVMGALGDPRDLMETVPITGRELTAGIRQERLLEIAARFGSPSFNILRSQRPAEIVTLYDYRISKYPVTCSEYARFLAESKKIITPEWSEHYSLKEFANSPAVYLSWEDANEYCDWLTEKLRKEMKIGDNEFVRLPTELEWEMAARGSDGRIFPWGDEWIDGVANTVEFGVGYPLPVGIFLRDKSPNGVLDMAGQIWEWTCDIYNPPADTLRRSEKSFRVLRGGSCLLPRIYSTTFFRIWELQDFRSETAGFRYVISDIVR